MRISGQLADRQLTIQAEGCRPELDRRSVADAIGGLAYDLLDPARQPSLPRESSETDPADEQGQTPLPGQTQQTDQTRKAGKERPSSKTRASRPAGESGDATATPAPTSPRPDGDRIVRPPDSPLDVEPAELADQLTVLVDDKGLRIEQAAARLGISRAKARKLYTGELA